MTLEAWSEAGLITRHQATPQEIADLFAIADTHLRDAAITELSPERKLACAYGAILSSARAALRATGYRVPKSNRSHHYYAVQSLRYTIRLEPDTLLHIEAIQKKRHTADYVRIGEITETLAAEARTLARNVLSLVRRWLAENHPDLMTR